MSDCKKCEESRENISSCRFIASGGGGSERVGAYCSFCGKFLKWLPKENYYYKKTIVNY